MTCNKCKYFKQHSDIGNFGRCRRYPPTSDGFSEVRYDCWCGEFKLNDKDSQEEYRRNLEFLAEFMGR